MTLICDLELPKDNADDGVVPQDRAQNYDAEWPQSKKDDVRTAVLMFTWQDLQIILFLEWAVEIPCCH
jgi:hypothetical protein